MTQGQRRDDWEAALARWRAAGLIDDDSAIAIRAWESNERSGGAERRRLADALSYLGVSIVLVAALMLVALTLDDGSAWVAAPFAFALVMSALAIWTSRAQQLALADGCSGAGVVLIAVGLLHLLDEVGGDGPESIAWLAVCLSIALSGAWLMRLVRSPLATFLCFGALTMLPLAVAVEGNALHAGIFGDGLRSLASWALWTAMATQAVVAVAALYIVGRTRRWLPDALRPYARLGASLGASVAMLGLAAASTAPYVDWLVMLVGWIVTAWALRSSRLELLPASALLLLGSLAGGLSDLGNGARIGLTIVVMITALELTALGMTGPRALGRLNDHWLTPLWKSALLAGGVVAASAMAANSVELAALGIIWAAALSIAGIVRERRAELVFGVIGVYASGLTLIIARFDTSFGAVVGTLVFGLLVVIGAIVWRRRVTALTLTEGHS